MPPGCCQCSIAAEPRPASAGSILTVYIVHYFNVFFKQFNVFCGNNDKIVHKFTLQIQKISVKYFAVRR